MFMPGTRYRYQIRVHYATRLATPTLFHTWPIDPNRQRRFRDFEVTLTFIILHTSPGLPLSSKDELWLYETFDIPELEELSNKSLLEQHYTHLRAV